MKPTVTFPVEVQLSYGKCTIPTLQKLTLLWFRTSEENKNAYRAYFHKQQGVYIDNVIEFAHNYKIVEPNYSNAPEITPVPYSERRLSEWEYEEQHRMYEAQKLK